MDEIETLSDDEKIDLLEKSNNDVYKARVIATLQDDDKKIEALKKLNDAYAKAKVIATLQDDDQKINLLEGLLEELEELEEPIYNFAISTIIATLKDDNKKLDLLEKLNNDAYKARVIATLQDDDKKIEALEKLNDDYDKAKVIATLQDDDKKIETLEKLSDDFAKADIIATLQDDDKKIETLERLNDDYAKVAIIVTLQDDDKKIEALERISDDLVKEAIIVTLQDDDKKIKALEKISDDFIKVNIIETLQDDNKKLELLEKFLDKRKYSKIGLDEHMTIGIEIESEGVKGVHIKELNEVIKKKVDGETRSWKTKDDASLSGGGVEIVSPILTDNKEDVEDIYMICSMLQKCGNTVSERCGGHIHIGADYLKSKEAYVNLLEIWGNAEKIIYKMSNEIGTIPRIRIKKYASSISPKLKEAIEKGTINLENEEDLEQFISEIQAVQGSRYSGLNLLNINNRKNTIEFRISNGTINPDTWIENVRLFGRIVQISQKLAEIEKQPKCSKEDKKLLELKEKLKEEIPEQEKMETLLELLFSEEERKVYRERYMSSSKLLEQIPDEENPLQGTEFSRVELKKHSLDEFHDVAVNDRSGTTNEATTETAQGVRTEYELDNNNMEEK